jgi:flagellar biosynthesis/type III secretory pathway protein FliH
VLVAKDIKIMKTTKNPTVLSDEELYQLTEELSDPKLEPKPRYHDWRSEFKYKIGKVADELAERIETEKKQAYQIGLAKGKKSTKRL